MQHVSQTSILLLSFLPISNSDLRLNQRWCLECLPFSTVLGQHWAYKTLQVWGVGVDPHIPETLHSTVMFVGPRI